MDMWSFNPLFIREIHQLEHFHSAGAGWTTDCFNPLFIREIHQHLRGAHRLRCRVRVSIPYSSGKFINVSLEVKRWLTSGKSCFNPLFIREIHQRIVDNKVRAGNFFSFNPLFIREIHQQLKVNAVYHPLAGFQSLIHQGNSSTRTGSGGTSQG